MFKIKGIQEHVTRQLDDIVGVLKIFSNSTLKIEERNQESNGISADLHSVIVYNIPTENIWIFDNEFYQNEVGNTNKILTNQKGAFSSAGQKVEMTIIYEKADSLYLILVEMKTSINSKKFSEVIRKMESSLSTISIFLGTHAHFSQLENKHLYPIGICCYNYLSEESENNRYSALSSNQSTFKRNFVDNNQIEFITDIEPIALHAMSMPFFLFENKSEPKSNSFDIDFEELFSRLEELINRVPKPPEFKS